MRKSQNQGQTILPRLRNNPLLLFFALSHFLLIPPQAFGKTPKWHLKAHSGRNSVKKNRNSQSAAKATKRRR